MNPPWSLAEEAVQLAFWAWSQDSVNTVVTLLVPERTQESWHRRFVQKDPKGKSVLTTVAELEPQERGDEPFLNILGETTGVV